jgi:hypothetical protein
MGELAHPLEHLADELRVEDGCGLVGQHHPGLHGQRPHDGHALLLTAAEVVGVRLGVSLHAHRAKQVHRALLGVPPRKADHPHRHEHGVCEDR